jgi:hypothetical protein
MPNTYLNRTTGTSPTSRQKFTFSAWFKLSGTSGNRSIFCIEIDGNTTLNVVVQGTQKIQFVDYNNSAEQAKLQTNRLLRDTNAWYHVVLAADSTQATNTDRLKMYINGVQETSFSSTVYPSQNYNFTNNVGNTRIGISSGPTNYFDGSMSHVHFIDGTAYAPTEFGEYDANGVWKIKTSPSVTYGNNGFFILKDGNSVTDQSPNTNNFTVGGGTLTNTEDSPSNVFATLNPLAIPTSGGANTFSNGNLEITNIANAFRTSFSTIGVSSGKWYWEAKFLSGEMKQYIGISKPQDTMDFLGQSANSYSYMGEIGRRYNNSTQTSYGSSASTGDIIMVAFDADNGAIWVGKNGTWFNSATQTEIENGTTTNAMYSSITIDDFFVVGATVEDSNVQFNFGNGYFGTTAVASAGTNASGNGIFEYDVPTGYTALSTKGLNL